MKKILLLLASFAVLFTACSEKEGGNEGGEPDPVEATLTVTPATLEFAEEGETLAFKVTTNVAWTVTTNADWLDLSAGSGNAGENLEVEATAEANETEEERSAVITVKAGDLSKAVTVTQGFVEPEVPTVDQNTTYKATGTQLKYASDFVTGKLYAFVFAAESSKCWTVASGALSMATYNPTAFTTAQVFEYTEDESKIDTSIDEYHNWSAGTLKSLATGKYVDEEFNANASAANALYIVFANNWGGNEGGEVNVMDMYHSKTTAAEKFTLWYHNDVFAWGDMNYGYDSTSSSTQKRKSIVFEVVANE